MRTKDSEIQRHLKGLRKINPEVHEDVWNQVEWRMKYLWDEGQMLGIQQMADNLIKAREVENG